MEILGKSVPGTGSRNTKPLWQERAWLVQAVVEGGVVMVRSGVSEGRGDER